MISVDTVPFLCVHSAIVRAKYLYIPTSHVSIIFPPRRTDVEAVFSEAIEFFRNKMTEMKQCLLIINYF